MSPSPPRLLVCRTCPRYAPTPAGQPTAGRRLAMAVRAAVEAAGLELDVRAVNCLAGCRNPCNAALDGEGRVRLRFSHLQENHVPALLATARAYGAKADGDLPATALDEDLRERLTARSPPRIGG